ncbi:MAG: lipocalin family protein [Saprospiraceae bacterium]
MNISPLSAHSTSVHRFICGCWVIGIALATLALASCQKANDKNPALLGKWQGTEWLIFDKPSDMDATQVHFEFKEDGTFTALFADQMKSGTWRTEKDKLYTKETGKQEILVKLLPPEPISKKQIEKMIADGNTEELLNLLDEGNSDLILLKAQYKEAKKQIDMGLIESAEWQRTVARINYAILEMSDSWGETKLTSQSTTIRFEMNRGGQKETLKLTKRQ